MASTLFTVFRVCGATIRLVEQSITTIPDSKPKSPPMSPLALVSGTTSEYRPTVGNGSVPVSADVHANTARGGDLMPINEHVSAREHGVHPHSSRVNPNLTAAQASKHAAFTPQAEEKKGKSIKDMFSLGGGGGAGVKRSRTLPTKRPARGDGEATGKEVAVIGGSGTGGRVLRKKGVRGS